MRLRQKYGEAAVRRRLARERGPAGPGEDPNKVPIGGGGGGGGAGTDANLVPIGQQVGWGGGRGRAAGWVRLLAAGGGGADCPACAARECAKLASHRWSHPRHQPSPAPLRPAQVSEEDELRAALPEGAPVPEVEWWDRPLLIGGRYEGGAGAGGGFAGCESSGLLAFWSLGSRAEARYVLSPTAPHSLSCPPPPRAGRRQRRWRRGRRRRRRRRRGGRHPGE
jgi:hypothetical protein